MTRLPDAFHDLVEWEIEVAYHQGYRAALADVASGHAELDACWRPIGRCGHGRMIVERLAEMEREALRVRARLDRWIRDNPVLGDAWPPVAEPGRPRRRGRPPRGAERPGRR